MKEMKKNEELKAFSWGLNCRESRQCQTAVIRGWQQ